MAQDDPPTRNDGRERESLDAFLERFGSLSDRMELQVNYELAPRDLPTAEHPQSIEARAEAAAAEQKAPEHDIWPDAKAEPDFTRAATNDGELTSHSKGQDSQQVSDDAPEHNLPPPRENEAVDRAAHAERMEQDNSKSRTMTDSYYEGLEDRFREAELDQRANGHQQIYDQGRDFEQSR